MNDPYQVVSSSTTGIPLSNLIAQASAALHDETASADDRVRRAAAILSMRTYLHVQKVSAGTSCSPKVGGLTGWQIQRVRTFVESSLGKTLSVADLASIAGFSRSHFSRAFRVSFQETPHGYLLRLRVERALLMLNNEAWSLCEIAAECGFSDQCHFNRVFRRRLGCSPGTWRRALRNAFLAANIDSARASRVE